MELLQYRLNELRSRICYLSEYDGVEWIQYQLFLNTENYFSFRIINFVTNKANQWIYGEQIQRRVAQFFTVPFLIPQAGGDSYHRF